MKKDEDVQALLFSTLRELNVKLDSMGGNSLTLQEEKPPDTATQKAFRYTIRLVAP